MLSIKEVNYGFCTDLDGCLDISLDELSCHICGKNYGGEGWLEEADGVVRISDDLEDSRSDGLNLTGFKFLCPNCGESYVQVVSRDVKEYTTLEAITDSIKRYTDLYHDVDTNDTKKPQTLSGFFNN